MDFFKEKDGPGQEALFNVIKAYSLHDREVGYCQGSGFIVGLLLMQVSSETGFIFTSIIYDRLSPDARGRSLRCTRTNNAATSHARHVQTVNVGVGSLHVSIGEFGARADTRNAYTLPTAGNYLHIFFL